MIEIHPHTHRVALEENRPFVYFEYGGKPRLGALLGPDERTSNNIYIHEGGVPKSFTHSKISEMKTVDRCYTETGKVLFTLRERVPVSSVVSYLSSGREVTPAMFGRM